MHGVRFELERFHWDGARLEVAGRWHGLAGGRLGHSTLTVEVDGRRKRVAAVAEEEPHRAAAGETWWAWFPWVGDAREVGAAELEVGRNLVIELPRPDVHARDEGPTPPEVALAHERAEVRRLRKQLAAVREEAVHALERERGETGRVREELAFVKEREADAERLRGELAAAEERGAEAERLREELAAAEARAGEVERLRGELAAAKAEPAEHEGVRARADELERELDSVRKELAAARAQREQAGEEAQRRQLELASSLAEERATAERLRKELETNGTDDGGKATPVSLSAARRSDTSEAPTARGTAKPAPRRPRPAAHHRPPPAARAERSRHAPWPVRIAAAGLLILLFATLVLLVDSIS